MSEQEAWQMTEKGWQIAGEIWDEFRHGGDIRVIAAQYGMDVDAATVLLAMAFQGGGIVLD